MSCRDATNVLCHVEIDPKVLEHMKYHGRQRQQQPTYFLASKGGTCVPSNELRSLNGKLKNSQIQKFLF